MFQLLIVDDDKNTRRFLRAVLTHAGYKVLTADCAREALDIMEISKIEIGRAHV